MDRSSGSRSEWIEGDSIQSLIARGPLPYQVASELLTRALDVCELLSNLLGEEAVWVETDLQSIIVGSPQSGRGVTFWISPLTWLGENDKSRGLAAIVDLTEKLMGWQNRRVHDQAGGGLGGWRNWLRHAAATTTLHEARAALAAAVVGAGPPHPARHHVAQAARRRAMPHRPPAAVGLWVVNLGLACLAAGLGGWLLVRPRPPDAAAQLPPATTAVAPGELNDPATPAVAAPAPPPVAAQRASERLTDARRAVALTEQSYAAHQNRGVIHWTSRELLAKNADQEVIVEGVLEKIDFSGRKKTMYLEFSKVPGKNDARGAVARKSAAADLSEAALAPLIGKKVRLHGTVNVLKSFGLERPEILVRNRASVEVIE